MCALTDLTARQLRYWDERGFFPPQYCGAGRGRPFSRIYSFRDVVGLRTLSLLRKKYSIPLQELRKAGAFLKERYQDPWASLTFYVLNRKVIFEEPGTGLLRRASSPEQIAMAIDMRKIAGEVKSMAEGLRERQNGEVGQIKQNRYVVHNAPVVAGTPRRFGTSIRQVTIPKRLSASTHG